MAKQKPTKSSQLKQRLKSLEAEILDLKNKSSVSDSDAVKNLEKITKIEEKRTENLKEYHKIKKELRDMEQESIKENKKEEPARTSQTRNIRQVTEYQEKLTDLQEKSSILMHSFATDSKKSAEILGITAKQTKELAGQLDLIKNLTDVNAKQNDTIQKTLGYAVKNAVS